MEEDYFLPTVFATTKAEFDQLCKRIVHYTGRRLSYPQDSLNAFLGIFADYEQQQAGPVLSRRPRPEVPSVLSSPLDIAPQPSHIWGLPLQLGARMLLWEHSSPPKERRSDFPSWSWTGWDGGVELGSWSTLWTTHSSKDPTFAPTSIEMTNQLNCPYDRRVKDLYITGATIELKFATRDQTQRIIDGVKRPSDTRYFPNFDVEAPYHHRLLEASPGVFVAVQSTMSASPAPQGQTIGLLVTTDTDNCFCASGMIVLQRLGQNFTRMGFINAGDLWEHKSINNNKSAVSARRLLNSSILPTYKFVNIDGEFVDKEMLPSSFFDGLSFGQDFVRQRICLE